jgi:hypothetical protein
VAREAHCSPSSHGALRPQRATLDIFNETFHCVSGIINMAIEQVFGALSGTAQGLGIYTSRYIAPGLPSNVYVLFLVPKFC